jgi:YidC/Oxa1 family membrane protein insertase
MFDFIAKLLGPVLFFIYNTIAFKNYGLSLIMFTILIKAALLPLTIKQLKSTQKMQDIQPELNKLQQRYKNDKEKLNQETMKIYTEKGVNPIGGCLPMLLQLPILFSLFYTIRKPLTYMYGWTKEVIGNVIIKVMSALPNVFPLATNPFLKDYDSIKADPLKVAELFERNAYHEINLVSAINEVPSLVEGGEKVMNLNFLGIFNLGVKPTYDFNLISQNPGLYVPALVMVLIAVATTYFSSKISMAKTQTSDNAQMNQTSKTMMLMGPIMTLFISFQAPLGLSLYWTISNATQIAQQLFIEKYTKKKKTEKEG